MYPAQWYTSDREFAHNPSYLALAWSKSIQTSLGSSSNKCGLASEVKVDIPLTDFVTWVSASKLREYIWEFCRSSVAPYLHLAGDQGAFQKFKAILLQKYRSACLQYIEDYHGHLVAYLPRPCFPHLPYDHKTVVRIQEEIKTNPTVSTLYFCGNEKVPFHIWLKRNAEGDDGRTFRKVTSEAFGWDEIHKPFMIRMTWRLPIDFFNPDCTYEVSGPANRKAAGDRTSF